MAGQREKSVGKKSIRKYKIKENKYSLLGQNANKKKFFYRLGVNEQPHQPLILVVVQEGGRKLNLKDDICELRHLRTISKLSL